MSWVIYVHNGSDRGLSPTSLNMWAQLGLRAVVGSHRMALWWTFRISRQVRHLRDLYFSKAPRLMTLKQPLASGSSLLLTSSSEGFILKDLIALLMLLCMPASAEDNCCK